MLICILRTSVTKVCMLFVTFLSLQLTMFLIRLNGHPIGMTAFNLFVLDSNAILSVSSDRVKH